MSTETHWCSESILLQCSSQGGSTGTLCFLCMQEISSASMRGLQFFRAIGGGGLIHFHSLCHFVFPLGQSWGTFLPWLGETRTQVCFATIMKRIPIDKHGTMGSSQLNPHPDRHQKMRALCVVVPFRNHFKGVDVSFDPEMCFDIIEYVNIVSSSFMHNNEQN